MLTETASLRKQAYTLISTGFIYKSDALLLQFRWV